MPSPKPAGADTIGKGRMSFDDSITKRLFDHWVSVVEAEIFALLSEKESVKVKDILLKTEISEETILLFIHKMVEEGKIKIKTVGIK